jgi:hypothetical protein
MKKPLRRAGAGVTDADVSRHGMPLIFIIERFYELLEKNTADSN